MLSDVWALVDKIAQLQTEESIVETLLSSAPDLGYATSTFWDVHKSSVNDEYFYVLRKWIRDEPRLKQGLKMSRNLLTQRDLESEVPRWFPPRRERDGRLCVPLAERQRPIAVWTLLRPGEALPTQDETDAFRKLAILIGLKLHEIRQQEIARIADKIFNFTAEPRHDALFECLSLVCRELSASFAAFFQIDPLLGTVCKTHEVFNDGTSCRALPIDGPDTTYRLGDCLPGRAAAGQCLNIPDYGPLLESDPGISRAGADSEHVRLMDHAITATLFRRIQAPGAFQRLIRVINRSDQPELPFTTAHQGILDSLCQPCAHVIAVESATKSIASIRTVVGTVLTQLQREGVDWSTISESLRANGFPRFLLTVWSDAGHLLQFWCNSVELTTRLQARQQIIRYGGVTAIREPALVRSDSLPDELSKLFNELGVSLLYLVPTREEFSERADPETALALVPLSSNERPEAYAFWSDRENLLAYLGVIGHLAGTARGLARNRHLLYLAEQAIGTIAHEVRAPAAGLQNNAQDLTRVALCAIEQIPRDVALDCPATRVDEQGTLKAVTLSGQAEVQEWIRGRDERIAYFAYFLSKVVSHSIRWARFSGKVVEADFGPVPLVSLLRNCVDELSKDIAEKPGLTISLPQRPKDVPILIGDEFYLHILFLNLLDNAVKYSWAPGKQHPFEVKVNIITQPALVDVEFINWGIGIASAEFSRIFSSFYRAEIRDRKHTVRGVGLGLAMCQRIVKLHRGEIRVSSRPTLDDPSRRERLEGYQTTFTVRLPRDLKAGRVDLDAAELQS